MHAAGWASAGRDNFDLAALVPAFRRGRDGCGAVEVSARVGTEAVVARGARHDEQLDGSPQPQDRSGEAERQGPMGVRQQIRELTEQARCEEEWNDPPAALAAVV